MSPRAAASALIHRLGPRVFGPATPSATPPRPLLAGCRQGGAVPALMQLLSPISTTDAKAYPNKGKHLSATAVKAEVAIVISQSEAKADVAEVYASKVDYAGIAAEKAERATMSASEAKADLAEVYSSKEKDEQWQGKKPSV